MSSNLFSFVAGTAGDWRIARIERVAGGGLPAAERLAVLEGPLEPSAGWHWSLRGFVSNVRYATRAETRELRARQPPLARPSATCAALIPIRKSAQWWELAQDERRAIFEERSRHTAIGLDALPAVARRLHHSRDLGEPFDFLTWFEYAPEHEGTFERLLERLRGSEEWRFVEREVDVRLVR